MAGALSHLRVLDLSRVLAGPWAAQTLADLGADVIKVERRGAGDDTRGWGPPFLKDGDGNNIEAAYYLSANRNKRSITIDLAQPRGAQLIRDLAVRCDVLIENYKVGGLARYGLAYNDIRAINPGIVYCSITGFGQSGPYASRVGYDFMIQGLGGLMSITGESDGPPEKVGVAITDITTGLYATIGILTALTHRSRTGEGQHIDMALFDAQVAALANQSMNYLVSGIPPQRLGNAHPNIVPYQTFRTRDGDIIVAVGNDGQFGRLCEVAGRPELAADPRFATNAARVAQRAALVPLLAAIIATRDSADWLAALQKADVPCGAVNDLAGVFADPQAQHRGMKIDLPHPAAGRAPTVANPIRLSQTPVEYRSAPPTLGQHTDDVLRSLLGLTDEQIAVLRRDQVI
ncbi:MAG TPA: CaiB/BaiF CoA-transferase family protein [Burkholderiales bacterium]|nr:CaiB/BaiF CoA-transferase family protein [Burkholderiales bacterium]